jgi:hypothetical protein
VDESAASRSFPDPSDPEARLDAVMARGRSIRRNRLVRRSGIVSAAACVVVVASVAVVGSRADTQEVTAADAPHATAVTATSASASTTSTSASTTPTSASTSTTAPSTTTTTATTPPPSMVTPAATTPPPGVTGQSTTVLAPPPTTPITTTTTTLVGLPPMDSLTVRVEGAKVILDDPYAPVPGHGGEMCVAVALVIASVAPQPGSEPLWHTSSCVPYGDSEVEPLLPWVIGSNDFWHPGPDFWRTSPNSEPLVGPITSYVAARAVFEVPLDIFTDLSAGTYPLRVIAYSGYRMWEMDNHASAEATVTIP